ICVPVKSGPSKAEPITPYFLNNSIALVFRAEVLPFFSRRRVYHFLILSNIKITGITVIIFPKKPTIITITGDSPQTKTGRASCRERVEISEYTVTVTDQ